MRGWEKRKDEAAEGYLSVGNEFFVKTFGVQGMGGCFQKESKQLRQRERAWRPLSLTLTLKHDAAGDLTLFHSRLFLLCTLTTIDMFSSTPATSRFDAISFYVSWNRRYTD